VLIIAHLKPKNTHFNQKSRHQEFSTVLKRFVPEDIYS